MPPAVTGPTATTVNSANLATTAARFSPALSRRPATATGDVNVIACTSANVASGSVPAEEGKHE